MLAWIYERTFNHISMWRLISKVPSKKHMAAFKAVLFLLCLLPLFRLIWLAINDDLSANPHEADIMMLLRQCRIHNIPVACNRHSADLMITSDLWSTDYKPTTPIYRKFDREKVH